MFKKLKNRVAPVSYSKPVKDPLELLHLLFLEYNTVTFEATLKSFKEKICDSIKNSDLQTEESIKASTEKFISVYGIPQLACEVFYILSYSYKRLNSFSKALEYARQATVLIDELKITDENTCKYLIHLASVLASLQDHKESLKLLKNVKFIAESLILSVNDQKVKRTLIKIQAVNLFNIGSEYESLKDFKKAEEKYKRAFRFFEKYPQDQELTQKLENNLQRVKKIKNTELRESVEMPKNTSFNFSSKYFLGSVRKVQKKRIKTGERPGVALSSLGQYKQTPYRNKSNSPYIRGNPSGRSSGLSSILNKSSDLRNSYEVSTNPVQLTRYSSNNEPNVSKLNKNAVKTSKVSPLEMKTTPVLPTTNASLEKTLDMTNGKINSEGKVEEKSIILCAEPEDSKVSLQIDSFFGELAENSTDTKGILQVFSEIDESRNYGENLQDLSMKSIVKPKILVHQAEVEFDFRVFKVLYKLEKSLNRLRIICKAEGEKYKLVVGLLAEVSLSEYIKEKIQPCLILQDSSLKLAEKTQIVLVSGNIEKIDQISSIRITKMHPRWKVLVEINGRHKYFKLSEILASFKDPGKLANDIGFLISLFHLTPEGILAEPPIKYPFSLLSEKVCLFENSEKEAAVQIFQVDYLNRISFLIQAKTDEKHFDPIIIAYEVLTKISNHSTLSTEKIVTLLQRVIKLNKSELFLEKSQSFLNLLSTRVSLASDHPQKSRKNHSHKKSNSSQLLSSSKISLETQDFSNFFINCKPLTQADYEDRIILRFSVYQDNKNYQVYMNYTDTDIIAFTIQSGIGLETKRKFSVDVITLCLKTGLKPDYVIPFASYILRNMLVIKESEVCYFDLATPTRSPAQALEKIGSLFKGFLIRRNKKIQKKNLVGKKKLKISGHTFMVLVYRSKGSLLLRFVNGFEVYKQDLRFSMVIKNGYYISTDQFLNSFPQLGIVFDPEIKKVSCNPIYEIS